MEGKLIQCSNRPDLNLPFINFPILKVETRTTNSNARLCKQDLLLDRSTHKLSALRGRVLPTGLQSLDG